jgi:hypothetical protein
MMLTGETAALVSQRVPVPLCPKEIPTDWLEPVPLMQFLDLLTPEDGTDTLFRHVGKGLSNGVALTLPKMADLMLLFLFYF